ncbi:MAG: type II toxin-antitoxin system HicB family antitoxin [Caulobacteraceae bacterium]
MRYYALIDGEKGAYGVSFPDLPGCVAMGETVDEAISNATEAVQDWAIETEAQGDALPAATAPEELAKQSDVAEALSQGALLVVVTLVREAHRSAKANMSLDAGVLAAIDASASHLRVNRSEMVEILAKRVLPALG